MDRTDALDMKDNTFDHCEQVPVSEETEQKPAGNNFEQASTLASRALSDQKTTKTMLLFSIWISFAGWIANFDLGYQGAVLIMPSYGRAFGHCQQVTDPVTGDVVEHCALSALQTSLTSVSMLFFAVGAALAGYLGTWL